MNKLRLNRPLSLTLRVTFWVSLVVALCLVLLSWTVQRSMNEHFIEQDIDELQVSANGLRDSLSNSFKTNNSFYFSINNSLSNHPWVHYLILDQHKNILFERSGLHLIHQLNQLEPVKKITSATLYSWHEKDTAYRGALFQYSLTNNGVKQPYYVFVAVSTNFHSDYLKHFQQKSWLVLFFAIVITFVATWLAVRHGHKPLRRISVDIHNINSSQLDQRLDTAIFPVELIDIVVELNQMLTRIETNYTRLSHFSDDIAHELRTPITNLMTLTQVTLNKTRDAEQYQEVLYANLEEYERLAKMVNDMLFLAKSENSFPESTLIELDLDHEVKIVFEYFEALANEKEINLTFDSCSPIILGDPAMIRRALSNLYSNAIRFTATKNSIKTNIRIIDTMVNICIENPGAAIPGQHIERLFDRFYRVDGASRNSTGVGLGLAITRSIIEFHHGSISVASDHKSTRFTIVLPLIT